MSLCLENNKWDGYENDTRVVDLGELGFVDC